MKIMICLLAFCLIHVVACGDDIAQEGVAMPYDVNEGSSSTRFDDGVTPIAAEFLNNCLVEFASQHDAIISKDVPALVCVAEEDYSTAPGGIVTEAAHGSATNLWGFALESTGGRLLLTTFNAGPASKRVLTIDRDTLAQVEIVSWSTGFIGDGYDALATDGERVWITGADSTTAQGYDSDDLAAGAEVSIALPYEVRSLATNGPHLVVASSDNSGAYVYRGYNRAGGSQLWSITGPWTSAFSVSFPEVAVDGRAAYLMGDEDSSGAKVRVRAVDVVTGSTLWTFAPAYEYMDAAEFYLRQRIYSNGEQVAILLSSRIVVINAYTGVELWTATYADPPEVGDNLTGLCVTWGADGRLYVGRAGAATGDGLYVYDGISGRLIWSTTSIAPRALVQDGAGLFAAYTSGAELRVARLAWGYSGPMVMQRVEAATGRYRRPAARALVPVYGMR